MIATLDVERGGWGMTPDLFWRLHPRDFWWMFESRVPPKKYGSLEKSDVAQMYRDLKKAEEDVRPGRRRG